MKKVPAKATEIGLVLQGGGALGAYEYGAITALLELIDEAVGKGHAVSLKAVTGVSIGAINAACVVGAATRTDARRRLASLWNDLVLETPMFWPRQARRDLALYGLPNFYSMRADVLSFSRWTHVYDTRPLLPTLTRHVDFAELNASDTAFVVTAVDVESGVLKRFSNKKLDKTERTTIEPQHVLASGSLPPQFPWTEIKEGKDARRYWDGGIVDNTPLTDAIDAFSVDKDVRRLLVVMNLFPQSGAAAHHAVRGHRAGRRASLRQPHAPGYQDCRPHQHAGSHDRRACRPRSGSTPPRACSQCRQGARLQAREDDRSHARAGERVRR